MEKSTKSTNSVNIEGIPFDISTSICRNAIIGNGTIQNAVPVCHILKNTKVLELKKTYHGFDNCQIDNCSICWQINRDEYWIAYEQSKNYDYDYDDDYFYDNPTYDEDYSDDQDDYDDPYYGCWNEKMKAEIKEELRKDKLKKKKELSKIATVTKT